MLRANVHITGNKLQDDLILSLLSFVTLVLLGHIQLDLVEGLPITLQSLLVVLFPLMFGMRVGLIFVSAYLLAGGLGAPVFAGNESGWDHFLGATGGFLLAFPIAALISGVAGEMAHKIPSLNRLTFITGAVILFVSQVVILLLGIGWMDALSHTSFDFTAKITSLMPRLLVKTALGTIVFVLIGRILNNLNSKR
ncbi:MAG: biotin transporter BioY [Flavobacteriales bacterium]|jgi:biotin transport system substrate-specific component